MSGNNDYVGNTEQVTGTGTPAEDIEEERAKKRLWDLKEDAKWGKDMDTQKKAIQDLSSGTPAISYLEEILSVLPPGEVRRCCQEAINSIIDPRRNEENSTEKTPLETKVRTAD